MYNQWTDKDMAHEKILIVEDDPDISEMISYNLGREGYAVIPANNGEDAVAMAQRERPALVVLDIMLPGMDGMEVCRRLKEASGTRHIPIIMLSAKSQETDKVVGLELGADDYVTKPFSPRELIARIRAVLRRAKPREAAEVVRAGFVEIDSLRHRVSVSGTEITLTTTEFKLIEYLAQRPGEAISRQKILDSVFGYNSDVYDRTVDTHIKTLRKKLGQAKGCIETVRGV
ncbi:MAG: response regulator transcription factor, partial [Thermodesulfovibrionales bacterium]|nr:response regulator transcription factor [Thermodesulfovibrionales bacterium]